MKIEIVRTIDTGTETLGSLTLLDGDKTVFACETLELPWKDNQTDISCIPKGTYIGVILDSTVRIPYPHINLPNVFGRSGICIHKANYVSELRGCIAVGSGLSDINKDGNQDVINSSDTYNKLMSFLPTDGIFEVEIK